MCWSYVKHIFFIYCSFSHFIFALPAIFYHLFCINDFPLNFLTCVRLYIWVLIGSFLASTMHTWSSKLKTLGYLAVLCSWRLTWMEFLHRSLAPSRLNQESHQRVHRRKCCPISLPFRTSAGQRWWSQTTVITRLLNFLAVQNLKLCSLSTVLLTVVRSDPRMPSLHPVPYCMEKYLDDDWKVLLAESSYCSFPVYISTKLVQLTKDQQFLNYHMHRWLWNFLPLNNICMEPRNSMSLIRKN